jgi:nucleoside-diphosphate-sugar epimerase
MQTILGAGGTIGSELAKELKKYTSDIRLVSRNPKKVNDTDQLFPADLTDSEQVKKAIEGSDIVYLVVGFEYNIKVWRREWLKLMLTTINACKANGAKLVFFDNVYLYDRDFLGNMTEETPIRPTSKKGQVRAEIAVMLMDEVKAGKLEGLIARAADFYGPKNEKSMLIEMVVKNMKQGKAANWFATMDKIHSFTYTPDAAKATAILGNTPDAYGQVWHLPTDNQKLTAKQWVELFAKEMKIVPKYSVLAPWLLTVLGWFVPIMKELQEMVYQYDRDYFFNSEKFEKRFDFKPTTYQEGVKKTLEL